MRTLALAASFLVLAFPAAAQEPAAVAVEAAAEGVDALPRLLSKLNSDDARTRAGAASAIGQLRRAAEPAVPRLLEMLEDDEEFIVWDPNGHPLPSTPADCAALALELIGAPAVPGLIEATKHRKPSVRWQAVWALGPIGDPRAADALVAALGDPNANVRGTAATFVPYDDADHLLEPYLEAASDRDGHVRQAMAARLARFDDPRAVEALFRMVRRDADGQVVCDAIDGLEGRDDPRLTSVLLDVLGNTRRDWVARSCAMETLATFDDPRVPEALQAATRDREEPLRFQATQLLGVSDDLQR